MSVIIFDPGKGSSNYSSLKPIKGKSTEYASGSAVIPSYQPSTYRFISLLNEIKGGNAQDAIRFDDKLRNLLIKQLNKDVRKDEEIYKQQRTFGIIIFVISGLLVIAGVGFSILQLLYTMKINDLSSLETTLQIESAGNLMLTTSTIGAFVLTISLVFFFLFLKFVYQPNSKGIDFYTIIREIGEENDG